MGPDSQSIDSLLDFLYIDRDRLASLVAQLHKSGVLKTTKTSDRKTGRSSGSANLGIPALGVNTSGGSETSESIDQEFDASWTLPLNVLDLLDERSFIAPSVRSAKLGQIFIARGKIRLLDFKVLRDCWEDVSSIVLAGHQGSGKHPKQSDKEGLKRVFSLLKKLPHSTELVIHTESDMIWTNADPKNLTITSDTLTFSHGSAIPGTWGMVGILDGTPDIEDDFVSRPMVKELQIAMFSITAQLRELLGRPVGAYAATPLVIYRVVARYPDTAIAESHA